MLELYSYGDFQRRDPRADDRAPSPSRAQRPVSRMPTDKRSLFSSFRRPASRPSLLRPWRPEALELVFIKEERS